MALALASLAACAIPAFTQAEAAPLPVVATAASPRPLPAGYYGLNYDYGGVSSYPQFPFDGFALQLAGLMPGTLRWPGGTGANYFQWRLGHPVAAPTHNPGSCPPPPEDEVNGVTFTLRDLRAASRASGAPPIFDLNVMTATLANQVAMLRQAQSLGLPVKYVELGNELYLCNNDYVHYFPTATSYGDKVARWVNALHTDFPGVTVAAVGALATNTQRDRSWNREMLTAAQAFYPDGAGLPDAITLHDYPTYTKTPTTAGLPALFSEPYTSVHRISTTLSKLPVARPAWITEYNLSPRNNGGAAHMYAQALFATEMDLLLRGAGGADRINYWTSFGTGPDNAYGGSAATPGLTPTGLALNWVDEAAASAATTARIDFAGGPRLAGTSHPALIGRVYSAGAGQNEVLLNLSGRAVVAQGGSAIPAAQPYRQATGDPVATMSMASQVSCQPGTTGKKIMLPPYSITQAGPADTAGCAGAG